MLRGIAREAVAEFNGTLTLIVFGCGVVAQVVLSRQTAGEYLSINLAWGLGVTMAVYVAGGVSGAHLNPAVTIALAVLSELLVRARSRPTSSRRSPAPSSAR